MEYTRRGKQSDIFNGVGVEIILQNPDDFLKVKETLTRIGVASKSSKTLYQTCHILHKQGRYAIVHFKELFKLDGRPSTVDESDLERRNTIVDLLLQWNLVKLANSEFLFLKKLPVSSLKVIPYKDKESWQLVTKYTIGKKQ